MKHEETTLEWAERQLEQAKQQANREIADAEARGVMPSVLARIRHQQTLRIKAVEQMVEQQRKFLQ